MLDDRPSGPQPKIAGPVHEALKRVDSRLALALMERGARAVARSDLKTAETALDKLRGAVALLLHEAGPPPYFPNAMTPISGAVLQLVHEAQEASK